jgi:hypothetical protein
VAPDAHEDSVLQIFSGTVRAQHSSQFVLLRHEENGGTAGTRCASGRRPRAIVVCYQFVRADAGPHTEFISKYIRLYTRAPLANARWLELDTKLSTDFAYEFSMRMSLRYVVGDRDSGQYEVSVCLSRLRAKWSCLEASHIGQQQPQYLL